MKVEIKDTRRTTVFSDLDNGDTFIHRDVETGNSDEVFMVIDNCPENAVELRTGYVISIEDDEIVVPINVKIVEDK